MVEEQTQQPVTSASNVQSQAPSDISKKTIIVLVILTVVISMLGTWTVMREMNNVKPVAQKGASQANIQFSILPQGQAIQTEAKQIGEATGHVALNILPSK